MTSGQTYTAADVTAQLLAKFFPERRNYETAIIQDFLAAHLHEYDRFAFAVRVGRGATPDPSLDPAIAAAVVYSSKKRIDMLLWQGDQPTIAEVKLRLVPAALGQLQAYSHLWLEDNPDARPPRLIAIARTSDDDTNRVLAAAGIAIYLYATDGPVSGAAGGGVSPHNDSPA